MHCLFGCLYQQSDPENQSYENGIINIASPSMGLLGIGVKWLQILPL